MTKPTPPTLRERNRYIVLELSAGKKLGREEVVKASWDTILRFLGEWGAGETGFYLMDWDKEKNRAIIRVNHKSVEKIRPAIALIKKVGETPVRPRILGVSGTLKKTRTRWMNPNFLTNNPQ
jgi:ribonuclease P/MRP protein subunit POP5